MQRPSAAPEPAPRDFPPTWPAPPATLTAPTAPATPAVVYEKLLAQQEADDAADPLPISTYIDPQTDIADLSKFDPSRRCVRAANGEATVFVSGVCADAPLVRAGAALQQVRAFGGPGRRGAGGAGAGRGATLFPFRPHTAVPEL
jgi:hypothetical protein